MTEDPRMRTLDELSLGHQPKLSEDCTDATIQTALVFGGTGLVWGQMQNMYRNPPKPIPADLTRVALEIMQKENHQQRMAHLGRSATFWAVAGATFTAVDCGVKSVRGKDDAFNKAAAGCAAGLLIGAPSKQARKMAALCASLALFSGATDFASSFSGSVVLQDPERYKRKIHGVSTEEDRIVRDHK